MVESHETCTHGEILEVVKLVIYFVTMLYTNYYIKWALLGLLTNRNIFMAKFQRWNAQYHDTLQNAHSVN